MEKPKISVIIASYNSSKTIEGCLKSLEEQTTELEFEIIVVDSSNDGTGELVERKFPYVKIYQSQERRFPGDARNIGISLAKGKIIAFIDADCRAEKNWIKEILRAHESPHPVIGGAIANADPKSYIGWAAYFCEFSNWMPGVQHGWLDDIPAANISYKREIFDLYGRFIEGTYCSDTEFHWRLGKDGHRLLFVPSILVSHSCIDKLERFLRHEVFHGKCFAKVRVHAQDFSRGKRLAYVLFSPLIFIRLFLKAGLNNINNRVYFSNFLRSLPLLTLGIICWSFGEFLGYLSEV